MEKDSSLKNVGDPRQQTHVSMGIPMIISMVLQAFYNIVDSAFVSNMKSGGEDL